MSIREKGIKRSNERQYVAFPPGSFTYDETKRVDTVRVSTMTAVKSGAASTTQTQARGRSLKEARQRKAKGKEDRKGRAREREVDDRVNTHASVALLQARKEVTY